VDGFNCDHQISTTTRVVDDAAYYSASGPSWTRTTVADGHKILAVRRQSGRLQTSQPVEKRNFYLPHLDSASPLGKIPSEFCRDLLPRKTKVTELSCGVVLEILRYAVIIQYLLVTDGQTDRLTDGQTR